MSDATNDAPLALSFTSLATAVIVNVPVGIINLSPLSILGVVSHSTTSNCLDVVRLPNISVVAPEYTGLLACPNGWAGSVPNPFTKVYARLPAGCIIAFVTPNAPCTSGPIINRSAARGP